MTAREPVTDPTLAHAGLQIRPLDATAPHEVALVATRMRQTLMEVVGASEGEAMYTMDWLVQRVLWHLDPSKCTGQVYVAETADGEIAGHTIVRIEQDEDGRRYGLFSTTYVDPIHRKQAIATQLLAVGEAWMVAQGLTEAATNTSATNTKLINLYDKHGYRIVLRAAGMIQLAKALNAR